MLFTFLLVTKTDPICLKKALYFGKKVLILTRKSWLRI